MSAAVQRGHWRDIGAVISYRDDESGPHHYDRDAYRERPSIERAITWLKHYRRIATRSNTLASSSLAMVTIACIRKWLELGRRALTSDQDARPYPADGCALIEFDIACLV